MENIAFNEIVSFDESKKFKRINETEAIEYFLNCNDDNLKKLFLDKFAIYIEKGLETKEFADNTMKDLMFIIYYLYDDPFSLLASFNEIVEAANINKIKGKQRVDFGNIIWTNRNMEHYFSIIIDIISEVKNSKSCRGSILSIELKNQLITYRNDSEFKRRKELFLKEYGMLDENLLKGAFEYYISSEYYKDGVRRNRDGFFDDNFYNDNRYEIYHYAYTYSLKKYGDEKTRKLFQPRGDDKNLIAVLEGDMNYFLNLKRVIAFSKFKFVCIRDLVDSLFGKSHGYEIEYKLRDLFRNAKSSFYKDFGKVVSKYSQCEEDYDCQTILKKVDFTTFLESNCRSIKDYCDSKGIDISLFKEALGYLKDETLLRQIEEKKHRLAGTRFAVVSSKVDKIVDYIMNGVPMDNETTREFDYLDYKLMTKLEFDDFKKLVCDNENANADIVRAISRFIGKNKNTRTTNIQSILNAKNIVGYGTDNEHEITDEEKLATIDYLKQHHLISKNGVIDSKVYNLAIKRYLAGTLFTEEDKDKIKNKS